MVIMNPEALTSSLALLGMMSIRRGDRKPDTAILETLRLTERAEDKGGERDSLHTQG